MKYLLISILGFMSACTYTNVSMAHTEGTASDVIDDTASSTPTISANLEIPLK